MAPRVPESVLKKRKRDEEWAAKKAGEASAAKAAAKAKRKDIFKRAEKYVKEYRDQVCPRRVLRCRPPAASLSTWHNRRLSVCATRAGISGAISATSAPRPHFPPAASFSARVEPQAGASTLFGRLASGKGSGIEAPVLG